MQRKRLCGSLLFLFGIREFRKMQGVKARAFRGRNSQGLLWPLATALAFSKFSRQPGKLTSARNEVPIRENH